MLYTEADLESSMDKIETINFHEEKDVLGVKFWAYNAGHVLGAAMFMIEIAGVKVNREVLKKLEIYAPKFFRFYTLETSRGRKIDI
jgi:Cft2 family RNA processing exonuclease